MGVSKKAKKKKKIMPQGPTAGGKKTSRCAGKENLRAAHRAFDSPGTDEKRHLRGNNTGGGGRPRLGQNDFLADPKKGV